MGQGRAKTYTERNAAPAKNLGELIAQRRQALDLRQVELALRIKGRSGEPVTQEMIAGLERGGVKMLTLPLLEQLPRALRLEPEVVYFFGGRTPPDLKPSGLSEAVIQEAWAALRTVLTEERARLGKPVKAPRPRRKEGGQQALRGWQGRKTLGGLIAQRRRQLGLTRIALSERVKGSSGEPVQKQRISDIEYDRFGVPRRAQLRQLARALKLDSDVLYLWAERLPPDIKPSGLNPAAVRKGWKAFRAVIKRVRRRRKRRKILR